MKLATLFRLKENLNLDRKTLVTLRWIALIGQFAAINIVFFNLPRIFILLFVPLKLSICDFFILYPKSFIIERTAVKF